MEEGIYFNTCRTCLQRKLEVKSIFASDKPDKRCYNEMVMSMSRVVISPSDGLPKIICEGCINELRRALMFRELCESSDAFLRNLLENRNCEVLIDRVEVVSENNSLGEEPLSENSYNSNQNKEHLADNIQKDNHDNHENSINAPTSKNNVKDEHCSNIHPEDSINNKSLEELVTLVGDDKSEEYNVEIKENLLGRHTEINFVGKNKELTLLLVQDEMSQDSTQQKLADHLEKRCSKSGGEFKKTTQKSKKGVENQVENNREPYKCDEGLAAYGKHMNQVHEAPCTCEQCGKRFKTESQLTSHISSKHKKKSKWKKPRQSKDKQKDLNRCNFCDKLFRFRSNLERHILTHTGEKPYLCNVCGNGFSQLSYLRIHSFIHTGEKPYKCQFCDKSFAAPGTLMTHARIHTGERPHVCKLCGKGFLQSGYLAAHIRTHTGEKPVECKVCHKRFNQSGRLQIHMRIHSGERPFSCNICDMSFAVSSTLKKHMRTHTGEKPYVCDICGQKFAQNGTLSTHMKVHNKEKIGRHNNSKGDHDYCLK